MGLRSSLGGAAPYGALILVECTQVGVTTLSKAAMSRGMNRFVFVVYYNALGTIILLPYAFLILTRSTPPSPLTFSLLSKLFLFGLIGCSAVILGYTGIEYSSPTLSSAIGNLVPAFTFILAILFRMEKIDLRSSSSQAKLLGTIISITGAFIVTLYKGQPIMITSSPNQLLSQQSNWIIGGLFLVAEWLLISVWYILMAAIVKEYPAELIIVFFYCFFATIQSAIFTLIVERDPSAWRLRLDIELIAIIYSAISASIASSVVHAWGVRKKGPVFVAMFKPLGIVIAIVLGVIFLGETLHLGSVIGSIIISAGFYGVMWGKAKEKKVIENNGVRSSLESSSQKVPLLQSNNMEI